MKTILRGPSIPESDITTPSSTRKYPMGYTIPVEDSTYNGGITEYTYIRANAAALTINVPVIMDLGSTEASAVVVSTPVTLGAPGARVVVPQVAFTSGYYGFVASKGFCECVHVAETYVVGDMLQLLSAGVSLAVDGSSGSTIKTVNTCGVTIDAGTTAVAKTIFLNGEQAVIAAS